MDDVKAWYRSRTVWGALIAILASLANLAGVEVTAAEEVELADIATGIAAAVGGLMALLGRIGARRRVG